jgi:RsiW-degrading membrane proteinase PrsW (M82 family)
MPPSDPRISPMYRRDIITAWAFVLGLWLVMAFVSWATWDIAPSGATRALLTVGGIIVLIFNTAAIWAMLAHYKEDREHIYGLDLKFLDAKRRS